MSFFDYDERFPRNEQLSPDELQEQCDRDKEAIVRILPLVYPIRRETASAAFTRVSQEVPEIESLTWDRIKEAMGQLAYLLAEIEANGRPIPPIGE